jgi:hypothetical protein
VPSRLAGRLLQSARRTVQHRPISKPEVPAPKRSLRSALGSLFDAVTPIFKSIATHDVAGPVARFGQHASRSAYLGSRSGVRSANSLFHHPRPSPLSRGVSQVGLGSARNFSSAQPLFQNIVHNAPLALRALGHQVDGFDAKKLRREVRRTIRKQTKLDAFGASPSLASSGAMGKLVELESSAASDASYETNDAESCFASSPASSFVSNVSLRIPLEPALPVHFGDMSDTEGSSRLLPRSFLASLRDVQELLDLHRVRLRSLLDRLERAGCFDDTDVRFWEPGGGGDGRGPLVIEFGGWWTAADVRQALSVWDGKQTWFDIIDHSQERVDEQPDLSCPALHDAVADTFVLPSVPEACRVSPLSPDTEGEDEAWSDSGLLSSVMSWESDMDDSGSDGLLSSSDSYRNDVRAFLVQVEGLDGAFPATGSSGRRA